MASKGVWIGGGLVALVIVAASCGANNDTPSAPAGSAPPAASAQGFRSTAEGKYGSPLVADDVSVTASAPKKISQQYLGSQVCSTVSYQNNGTDTVSFNLFDWKFRTPEGVEAGASIPYSASKALNSGDLAPRGKVSGQVCSDSSVEEASAVVYSPGFGIMNQLVWTK